MESLAQDIRYSLRSLTKRPVVVVVALLSLALGIGINTAIFSVLNVLVLKPLPVREADRAMFVFHSAPGKSDRGMSFPAFTRYRERTDVFAGATAFTGERPLLLVDGERRDQVYAEVVAGEFFSIMDVHVPLGRPLGRAHDDPAAEPVVVLGHDFWQRRFGSNPQMVGSTIVLNDRTFTVIGIAAAGFTGLAPAISADLWMPASQWAHLIGQPERLTSDEHWFSMIGRLAPGVTTEQARAALTLMGQQMPRPAGEETRLRAVGGIRLDESVIEALSLAGAAFAMGVVLLALACANVANLLLARAAERQREMAVRVALGSGRARLMRLWLCDGVILCLAAGAAGMLVAAWSLDLAAAVRLPTFIGQAAMPALSLRFELDLRVFGFAVALSLLTGVLVGVVSALQAWRPDLTAALNSDRQAGGPFIRSRNPRSLFIALQMTLSLLLLIPCGLFVRSWQNASAIDPGFTADGVVLLPISSDQQGVRVQKPADFEEQIVDRVMALPGVEAATVMDPVPLWFGGNTAYYTAEDGADGGMPHRVGFSRVTHGYFTTMRIPIVRGRDFTRADLAAGAPPVVIVNETLARRLWGNGDALGKRLRSRDVPFEVVGIARDAKYLNLAETSRPWLYRPMPRNTAGNPALSLAVRATGDPISVRLAIQREVQALVPEWPVFQFRALAEGVDLQRLVPRFGATLLGALGMFGLVLAAIGIYGVVAYSVTQRTREIGIRLALGARHQEVVTLMVRQGMAVCLIGAAAGSALALAASRFLVGLLNGVSASDPLTYVSMLGLLIGVALVACYLPARRATRVEPVEALRQ